MSVSTLIVLAFLSAYSYFVYPVVLFLAAFFKGRRVPSRGGPVKVGSQPARGISLIITAHDEEERIRAKLENTLALTQPPGGCEIIVASDASRDGTDDIARGYPGVKLVRAEERRGKEHAQRQAIAASRGGVLIFTDVATWLEPGALLRVAEDFRDPGVGAVSSTDALEEGGGGTGEGLYVRYEMMLRDLETRVRGVVGLSGSFFAARREVCEAWTDELPSDFNTVFICARLGYRAVADPLLIGRYRGIRGGQSEFQRKVRTLVRGITALFANLELLDFTRYGLFSFQLFSHKLMRWLTPVFMIMLLLASLAGAGLGSPAAIAALALQAAFYGLAWLGWRVREARSHPAVRAPLFFIQANLAVLAAWGRFLRGERISLWNPSRR